MQELLLSSEVSSLRLITQKNSPVPWLCLEKPPSSHILSLRPSWKFSAFCEVSELVPSPKVSHVETSAGHTQNHESNRSVLRQDCTNLEWGEFCCAASCGNLWRWKCARKHRKAAKTEITNVAWDKLVTVFTTSCCEKWGLKVIIEKKGKIMPTGQNGEDASVP